MLLVSLGVHCLTEAGLGSPTRQLASVPSAAASASSLRSGDLGWVDQPRNATTDYDVPLRPAENACVASLRSCLDEEATSHSSNDRKAPGRLPHQARGKTLW